MRLNVILRFVGIVLVFEAVFMLISALVALGCGDHSSLYPLVLSGVLTLAMGAFPQIFVEREGQITSREGYVIVTLAWLAACFAGTFPFLLWNGEFSATEAFFETVSGFTTTGATCIADVDGLPRGLLFWRSSTHWLGGVGVVMFAMIILPSLGRNMMTLSSAELSPLARDNYRYRAQKIARIVLMLYVAMTILSAVLLRVAGMGWFDAVNHAFSIVSTGGFSTRTASLAAWNSVWIEGIAALFMLLSSVHFGLLFATITGRHGNIFRSEVSRFFLIVIFAIAAAITLDLWLSGVYPTLGESARYGVFHAVSTTTTTGLVTADTGVWPPLSMILLIYLLFQGACAGSTSGGIKADRIYMALKTFKAQLVRQQHPNAVVRVKLNNVAQDQDVVSFAMFFIVLYLLVTLVGTIVVTATGVDLATAFTMTAACMGNAGPGFGTVGTMSDYAHIAPFVKVLCSIFMLLGRLEIFGLMQLFMIKW